MPGAKLPSCRVGVPRASALASVMASRSATDSCISSAQPAVSGPSGTGSGSSWVTAMNAGSMLSLLQVAAGDAVGPAISLGQVGGDHAQGHDRGEHDWGQQVVAVLKLLGDLAELAGDALAGDVAAADDDDLVGPVDVLGLVVADAVADDLVRVGLGLALGAELRSAAAGLGAVGAGFDVAVRPDHSPHRITAMSRTSSRTANVRPRAAPHFLIRSAWSAGSRRLKAITRTSPGLTIAALSGVISAGRRMPSSWRRIGISAIRRLALVQRRHFCRSCRVPLGQQPIRLSAIAGERCRVALVLPPRVTACLLRTLHPLAAV